MQHIFFLHSNICTIVAYETIKELIENREKVTIILNRGMKFPFFKGFVRLIDFQYITDEYRNSSRNILHKFLNYRFHYLPQFDKKAKEIIDNKDFVLYTPSYNQFTLRAFFKSSYLKGYYYLEEGTMAYISDDILKRIYYSKLFFRGRLFSGLFGVKEHYDYKITSKFKGAICLSSYAFPWLKKNKRLTTIDEYLLSLDEIPLKVDAIVVTGYLFEDVNKIYKGLDLIFNHILSNGFKKRVAVKFHPTAYSYDKHKCEQIRHYIENKYFGFEIIFVTPSYSIEGSLYRYKTELYSIFGMSSLCLYSLILGSSAFVTNLGTTITLEEVHSVNDFLAKANNN